MVTDQEIASHVESLLRLIPAAATVTSNDVVRKLESDFHLDLSHKKDFIQQRFDLFFGGPQRTQKDHFALTHHAQFHQGPLPHPQHQQFQIPAVYHHHHQQIAFGYAPPPLPPTIPAAAEASSSASSLASAVTHQHPRQQQQPQVMHAAVDSKPKESAPTGVKRRGGPGGLNKVCGVSPELQAIVGEPTMARTQIVKQLWAYIRKNNLQDPSNKRKIICNDELRLLFETDCTDMFKMNKLLAKHIIPLEPTKVSGPKSKKLKVAAEEAVSVTEHDAGRNLVAISDALANFFGTGVGEMLQTEASKRVWDYIKDNHLEDSVNPMVIYCDSKLQQLFGCESISALGISEMLARHLFERS